MIIPSALYLLTLSFVAANGREFNKERFFGNIFLNKCAAERREPWSYRGLNGPKLWGLRNNSCYGCQQSPIAIDSRCAIKDENLAKLTLNGYDQPIERGIIENNGHTVEIAPTDGVRRTIFVNGDEYILRQLHFHWGDASHNGAEHTINGIRHAMEMHLVHMNSRNQIAVVGIFLEEQDVDSKEFQKVVDELSNVLYKGDNSSITPGMNLNNLLPANPTSFYRYQGSLTTPPCSEGVTWSVVPDPIPVRRDQINQFFKLYSVKKEDANDNCHLVNNYRPLQRLNRRKVYRSQ